MPRRDEPTIPWRAALIAVLALSTSVFAIAPLNVRHTFTGAISPDHGEQRRVSMRLLCIMYTGAEYEYDLCKGRFQCVGRECPVSTGRAVLKMYEPSWSEQREDPAWPATMTVRASDGRQCEFVGRVAYRLGIAVPAFSGRYECSSAGGAFVDPGIFGVRATEIGKPYLNLN